MAKTLSLLELFDAYPSSDLLGCGPPLRDESPPEYEARVEQEGGDTLYLFLVRELTDADERLDVDTVADRVRRAIDDLQAVLDAVESRPKVDKGRARLTVEVDYDAEITDPESLATATDKLMKTACSTPGILDDYGNPIFGTFLVAGPSYSLNIGGPELRRQLELLQNLQGAARAQMPYWLSAGETESLEGLVNLTDEIADQAHDCHGIDCLPKNGNTTRQDESHHPFTRSTRERPYTTTIIGEQQYEYHT